MTEDISAMRDRSAGARGAERSDRAARDGVDGRRDPAREHDAGKDRAAHGERPPGGDRSSGGGRGFGVDRGGAADREPGGTEDGGGGADGAAPDAGPRPPVDEREGPVSERDALLSLTEGDGHGGDAERSEALRAGAIADAIARRLKEDASGTRIGTLALFNDTVSFGGGFHAGGARGGGARRPGGAAVVALDPGEHADHTGLFVRPEGFQDAVGALGERRLVVLTGLPGSGREATAVNLLDEALALDASGAGGLHRLLTPASLLEPGWEPPVRHAGYLLALEDGPEAVDRLLPASAAGGTGGTAPWAAVVSALRDAGCLLVLTGGHDLEALAAWPGGEHVAHHPLTAVDPVTIVERRVVGADGTPAAYAELRRLLERTGAAAALREQPSARNAARLAAVVGADGDVHAEAARLRDPSEQVRAWFHRHRTPEAVAFAVTAAVLEHSGYLTVADAAVRLRAALTEPEQAPPDVRFGDRLGHEQQWIELYLPDAGAGPGAGHAAGPPRVRFRSALLGPAVLGYAWNALDGRREAVLDWLRRLLNHPDLEVRARAAVAAGVLTLADPHHATHRFLTGWAGSTSWPLRQAAATALGVAGSRPEAAETVWELLNRWARGGSSAQQRRLAGTAANAVGGLLGRDAPDRAVAVLRAALDRGDDWGTLPSVAWGGLHLAEQGRTKDVLDAWLDWSAPRDLSPLVVKTLSAFVFAASRPHEPSGASTPADGTTGGRAATRVPGVPVLFSELPCHQERLAELWARALARRPVQDTALEALRDWIDTYADLVPGSLDAVGRLLDAVALRPGRHRERLEWWLEKWARDRNRPSKNAARLLGGPAPGR
ncbi:hypothetical protein ACIPPJ_07750 [Streptomyces sp. NPDC086091]|uniref:hypothetical protein n=1 Tax=Streptomyces sp. NPDC086091 TaxID=3365751 RepID=UPI003824F839